MIAYQTIDQFNNSRYFEKNRSRPNVRGARFPQAPFAGIVQIGHVHDLSAATAHRHTPVTFRVFKSESPRLKFPHISRSDFAGSIHFVNPPKIRLKRCRLGKRIRRPRLFALVFRTGCCRVQNSQRIRSKINPMLLGSVRRCP